MLLAQLLFFSCLAFGTDKTATCELASKSIPSRSSSGIAQVSNLEGIQITCRVPARPFPTKPGEIRNGLRAATSAYQISPDGSKKLVPSEVRQFGGGGDGFAPRVSGINRLHGDVVRDLHAGVAQEFRNDICFLLVGIEECSKYVPEGAIREHVCSLRRASPQVCRGNAKVCPSSTPDLSEEGL
jgi:hypothetical protein